MTDRDLKLLGCCASARITGPLVVIALCSSARAAPSNPVEATTTDSPPQKTCPDVRLIDSHAALAEWAFWLSGGVLFPSYPADENTGAVGGVGAEMTFQLFEYEGFPSGHRRFRDAELRLGPWLSGGVRDAGAFGEGGIKAHLGAVRFNQWGAFDFRAGAGYGEFPGEAAPHLSGGLGWGIRTVVGRYTSRGYCDPPAAPKTFAEASLLRIVVMYRRAFAELDGSEIALALELSPTFFLPPAVCEHFVVH